MKLFITSIVLGTAIFCSGADKLSPQQEKTVQEFTDFSKYAITEEAFRKITITSPEDAGKVFFSNRAAIRWNRLVKTYSPLCISDFFTGAIVLRGKFDLSGSVGAYYNPFWDTLFIFQSTGLPDIPKIQRFYFIPGEAFRNENYTGMPDCSTVVSLKDPISVNLLKKSMLTFQKFNATLAEDMNYEDFIHYKNADKNEEIISVRAGIRLKLKSMLMNNRRHYQEAFAMCSMLRRSNEKQMKALFNSDVALPMVELFCRLPEMFKKDFVPYLYVPVKEGRLYIMVNKMYPRLFVAMTFYNNGTNYSMEWYDLNDAEKIIKVWNSRKETK